MEARGDVPEDRPWQDESTGQVPKAGGSEPVWTYRRYRYYELWSYRVRLMEPDFFATMLVPPFHPTPDWAESLAENLLHPQFPISLLESLSRRLRRNCVWIYLILGLAWLSKVWLHPSPAGSWQEFMSRAAIGRVPG